VSVFQGKTCPAIHFSPEEKSGAAAAIGFINKGLCCYQKKIYQTLAIATGISFNLKNIVLLIVQIFIQVFHPFIKAIVLAT